MDTLTTEWCPPHGQKKHNLPGQLMERRNGLKTTDQAASGAVSVL
jgi:hypothetical protein